MPTKWVIITAELPFIVGMLPLIITLSPTNLPSSRRYQNHLRKRMKRRRETRKRGRRRLRCGGYLCRSSSVLFSHWALGHCYCLRHGTPVLHVTLLGVSGLNMWVQKLADTALAQNLRNPKLKLLQIAASLGIFCPQLQGNRLHSIFSNEPAIYLFFKEINNACCC